MLAAGAAQASTGFSRLAMTLSMLASSLFLFWIIVVGVLMWWLRTTSSLQSGTLD
jgi:hypothetical protein